MGEKGTTSKARSGLRKVCDSRYSLVFLGLLVKAFRCVLGSSSCCKMSLFCKDVNQRVELILVRKVGVDSLQV